MLDATTKKDIGEVLHDLQGGDARLRDQRLLALIAVRLEQIAGKLERLADINSNLLDVETALKQTKLGKAGGLGTFENPVKLTIRSATEVDKGIKCVATTEDGAPISWIIPKPK
jgi:hypothetical protein